MEVKVDLKGSYTDEELMQLYKKLGPAGVSRLIELAMSLNELDEEVVKFKKILYEGVSNHNNTWTIIDSDKYPELNIIMGINERFYLYTVDLIEYPRVCNGEIIDLIEYRRVCNGEIREALVQLGNEDVKVCYKFRYTWINRDVLGYALQTLFGLKDKDFSINTVYNKNFMKTVVVYAPNDEKHANNPVLLWSEPYLIAIAHYEVSENDKITFTDYKEEDDNNEC